MSSLDKDADRLLSQLKVRHLRVVVALGELGSLVAVASRFHVTSAAISKTLAEIEALLGMTLFERSRYKLEITDAGLCMIAEAKIVLNQMERMSEALTSLGRGVMGRLAVASATASAQPFIAEVLSVYAQQYPLVSVSFSVESSPKKVIQRLIDGELDLLFDYTNNAYEHAGLVTQAVIPPQKLLVVASKSHPLSRRSSPSAAQLHAAMWCIPAEWSRLRPHLEAMFRKHGFGVPEFGISTSDLAMLQTMLQARECLTIMPERVARYLQTHDLGRIVKFDTASQVERIDIIWSEKIRPRATASLFRALAFEISKPSSFTSRAKLQPRALQTS
jgi:DNA-binding transcriptional LysR family regulator